MSQRGRKIVVEMTSISVRITLRELAEIDDVANDLGCSRTEIIRARLRWAVAAERVASGCCHTPAAPVESSPLLMAAE